MVLIVFAHFILWKLQWRSKGGNQGALDPGRHVLGGGTLLIKIKC